MYALRAQCAHYSLWRHNMDLRTPTEIPLRAKSIPLLDMSAACSRPIRIIENVATVAIAIRRTASPQELATATMREVCPRETLYPQGRETVTYISLFRRVLEVRGSDCSYRVSSLYWIQVGWLTLGALGHYLLRISFTSPARTLLFFFRSVPLALYRHYCVLFDFVLCMRW